MKISELIERLKALQRLEGDLDCIIFQARQDDYEFRPPKPVAEMPSRIDIDDRDVFHIEKVPVLIL
jgi:hypothetical protein